MKNIRALSLLLVILFVTTLALARETDNANPAGSIEHSGSGWWSAKIEQVQAEVVQKTTSWKEAAKAKIGKFFSYFSGGADRTPASEDKPVVETTAPVAVAPGTETAPAAKAPVAEVSVPVTKSYPALLKQMKSTPVVSVAKAAIPASPKLARTKAGVPYLESAKLKALKNKTIPNIPLLYIGREPELAVSFVPVEVEAFPLIKGEAINELPLVPTLSQGEHDKFLKDVVPFIIATPAEKLSIPVLLAEQKVTLEKVASLTYTLQDEKPIQLLPVVAFNAEDLKMLRALILIGKKDLCHQAAGLLSDLTQSKNEDIQITASYHLGICLSEMKLPNEAIHVLGTVMRSEDRRFMKTTMETLLSEYQYRHEEQLAHLFKGVKDRSLHTPAIDDSEAFLEAKYNLHKGNYQKALDEAEHITAKDPNYVRAQYIAGVAEYLLGKKNQSMERQRKLAEMFAQKGGDKEVAALVNLNLGRVAFQNAKFKEAVDAYQRVPKEHPLWIQALTEMGWAQLQTKDAPGAIGNMHSIQSPYFDGAYKSESYVVRTIGYLNICQYGDAFKTLSYFESKYQPWLDKMDRYMEARKESVYYYTTAVKFLSNVKSTADVDGLPYQVVREIAHHKDFLNAQEAINQFVDEGEGYGFIRSLIDKDRKNITAKRIRTQQHVAQLKELIKKAPVTPGAMKNMNAWKQELRNDQDLVEVLAFKLEVLGEGEKGFKAMQPLALNRIAAAKTKWKEMAALSLRKHLKDTARDLKLQLANNEFLRYEVYAGSGENLRSHMAGGAPPKYVPGQKIQMPRGPSPEKAKWEFEGEFWEDEIGNYRSSLKNNCQNTVAQKE